MEETIIAFILQKANFQMNGIDDYLEFKEKMMNHKLMDFILLFVKSEGKSVMDIGIEPIIACAECFSEICR